MNEHQPTLSKPAAELRDGDEFSVDGGRSWHVCAVPEHGTVAVYLDDRRGIDAHTARVEVERTAPVLVRTDAATARQARLDPGEFVLDLDRIAEYVRVLGVDAHVRMGEAHTPVIVAGTPSIHEEDGHEMFPAIAGPASESMPFTMNEEDLPRVVGVQTFLVGSEEHDPTHLIGCWSVGIYDEALVAYLIAAQVSAPRGTLVDQDTVARIARGEIRPGWRREDGAPTDLGGGNWVTRYIHPDGLIVDDNTRNLPEDLRRDIAYEGRSDLFDDMDFVGHTHGGGWDQFPSITVAMLFAEGRR